MYMNFVIEDWRELFHLSSRPTAKGLKEREKPSRRVFGRQAGLDVRNTPIFILLRSFL